MEKHKRSLELWNKIRNKLYYEKRTSKKDILEITLFKQEIYFDDLKKKNYIKYYISEQKEPFLIIPKLDGKISHKSAENSSVDVTGILSIL